MGPGGASPLAAGGLACSSVSPSGAGWLIIRPYCCVINLLVSLWTFRKSMKFHRLSCKHMVVILGKVVYSSIRSRTGFAYSASRYLK